MRRPVPTRRAGFSLIELVLASGLMALLMIGVIALVDGSMTVWRKAETRRDLSEQAIGMVELLAGDLEALEGGARGDLLVEWVTFDTDGDEIKETTWPRLRMVRQASRAELVRMFPPAPAGEEAAEGAGTAPREEILGPGLVEVCWAVLPVDPRDPDRRAEGLVLRGARRLTVDRADSFFDSGFVRAGGKPDLSRLDEVTAGLLWFQPLMATQTSIVHDGWIPGVDEAEVATAWDAWNEERPDTTVHAWNELPLAQPRAEERCILPRRFRVELEVERQADLRRRARTLDRIEPDDLAFGVTDGTRLPRPGAFVKVDGEWMRVAQVRGDRVQVERGQRGTAPVAHDPGALLHWGLPLVRELPVALYREDWDL
jgi:hypothetical protein